MLCITDANIWIDLEAASLFRSVFELEVRWAAPDVVIAELGSVDTAALLNLGLEERALTAEQVERVTELATEYRRPSPTDLAALVLAEDEGAVLATGDGALREAAQERNVEVHGILWILDWLVAERRITASEAAAGLKAMVEEGAYLPKSEVQRRLKRWE